MFEHLYGGGEVKFQEVKERSEHSYFSIFLMQEKMSHVMEFDLQHWIFEHFPVYICEIHFPGNTQMMPKNATAQGK